MRVSLRTSLAAFALSSALAGVAAPAFADSYYPGIDPNNPPGTLNQARATMPRAPAMLDPTATGSIDGQPRQQMLYPTGNSGQRYDPGEGDFYPGIVPPTP